MCWYDEQVTKTVKNCKDDREITENGLRENQCINIKCIGNTSNCAPSCVGCGTKSEFCGK